MARTIESWEEVAEDFAAMVDVDAHRKFVLIPAIKRMLNSFTKESRGIENKWVFDAGCGEGGLARMIAEKGAQVLAVDFSEKMIEIAKKKTQADKTIKYEKINLLKPLPYPSESFDLIINSLVLMDMPKVKKPLKELSRILKDSGQIIIAISHPSYTVPFIKLKRRMVDILLGQEAPIRIASYPAFARVNKKVHCLNKTTPYFHRRVSFYFNALASAGFKILEVREPLLAQRYLRYLPYLSHAVKIPVFLLIRAEKA